MAKSCVDEAFYVRIYSAGGSDEARAVLLGKLTEGELDDRLEREVRSHLQSCSFCAKILRDLQAPDELKTSERTAYAVCPSSEIIDIYVFNRETLPAPEIDKLAAHIAECPLCHEETEWLQRLEASKVTSFRSPVRRWADYIAIAAAFAFFTIAAALWWKQTQVAEPDRQLRALAVIKEPYQIDFDGLARSASQLDANDNQLYSEAVGHFKAHQFDRAAGLFQKILDKHPGHSASLYLLGYSYYKLNQAEKAFELCQRAERIQPHSYERCMTLVQIALMTGHFDRALMEISALYHENPDHPEIRRMYGEIISLTRGRTLKM